jgi:DnaK suppressor protein
LLRPDLYKIAATDHEPTSLQEPTSKPKRELIQDAMAQKAATLRHPPLTADPDWSARIEASAARLLRMADEAAPPARAPGAERVSGDEGDIAQVVVDGELTDRLTALRASLTAQVSRALDQLGLGRYGYCEDCGDQIPAERIEFAPESTRCVNCQARYERTH